MKAKENEKRNATARKTRGTRSMIEESKMSNKKHD